MEPVWFQVPLPDTKTPPAVLFPTTLEGPVTVPIVLRVPTPVSAATPRFVAVWPVLPFKFEVMVKVPPPE